MGKMKLDFTGVESYVKASEGEHIAVLKAVEEKTSQNGNDMLSCSFEIVKGNSTGAKVYDNFVITEKALWKLKGFLEMLGFKADGKILLDLDKLVGKTCIINVVHEDYNGNTRAKIDGYKKFEGTKPKVTEEDDDFEEEVEEVEEPKPAPKKATPAPAPAKKEEKKQPAKKPAPVVVEDEDDWDEVE